MEENGTLVEYHSLKRQENSE